MPQRAVNPVEVYNKSGGVRLINPTDRSNRFRYQLTARELRTPAVIRGTPPTYLAPAASALTTVAPTSGPQAGGTGVTLTGTGFGEATGATFGGAQAIGFLILNSTTITCITPPHAAGAVTVIVQDPLGDGTKASGFTYV